MLGFEQPNLHVAINFSPICGPKLESSMHVCRFDGDLRQGLTTALCLGTDETWAAAATSSGLVSVWDLRYSAVEEPWEGTSSPQVPAAGVQFLPPRQGPCPATGAWAGARTPAGGRAGE